MGRMHIIYCSGRERSTTAIFSLLYEVVNTAKGYHPILGPEGARL